MKKIITTSLIALLTIPAFAGGEYHQQTTEFMGYDILPYLALRGGSTYSNLNVKLDGDKENISDAVFQGRVAMGLSFYDAYRFEIEGSFFTKAKDTADFSSATNVDIETSNIELMANTYMNLGHYKHIQPFVGIGAGIAFTDTKLNGDSNTDTKFSGMGTLGLSMPFGCFAVDVAARYNYVDVESGMHNFSGDVGIRYLF